MKRHTGPCAGAGNREARLPSCRRGDGASPHAASGILRGGLALVLGDPPEVEAPILLAEPSADPEPAPDPRQQRERALSALLQIGARGPVAES